MSLLNSTYSYVQLMQLLNSTYSYVQLMSLLNSTFNYVQLMSLLNSTYSYVQLMSLLNSTYSYVQLMQLLNSTYSYVRQSADAISHFDNRTGISTYYNTYAMYNCLCYYLIAQLQLSSRQRYTTAFYVTTAYLIAHFVML